MLYGDYVGILWRVLKVLNAKEQQQRYHESAKQNEGTLDMPKP